MTMTLCVNVRIIFFEQISDHNKHSSGRSERINDNNEQINEQITERQRAVLEFTRVTPDATYDVMARAVCRRGVFGNCAQGRRIISQVWSAQASWIS